GTRWRRPRKTRRRGGIRLLLSGRVSRLILALITVGAVLLTVLLLRHAPVHAQSPEPNQITVYSPQTSYSVPVLEVNGQPYAGLVELLEPLGSVDARPDGKKYKLRFTPPGGHPKRPNSPREKTRQKFVERITSYPRISFYRTAGDMCH